VIYIPLEGFRYPSYGFIIPLEGFRCISRGFSFQGFCNSTGGIWISFLGVYNLSKPLQWNYKPVGRISDPSSGIINPKKYF